MIDPNITIGEIRNPRLKVGDILKRIQAVEAVEFVHKIPSHSHIAFLHTNDNSKDKMLAAFFDTMINGNASRGLFSLKPANDYLSCSNNIMLYEELLQEPRDYEVVARRVADWIAKLNSSGKSRQIILIAQLGLHASMRCGGFEMVLLVTFCALKNQWVDICKTICLLFVDIIFQMLVMDILMENRTIQ